MRTLSHLGLTTDKIQILSVIFVNILLYLYLNMLSNTQALSLFYFYAILIGLFAINVYLFIYLERKGLQIGVRYLVIAAVLFRIIGLLMLPIYEDDYYRYLWDGYMFFHQGTPYGIAPSDYFLVNEIPIQYQRILGLINNPEIPTIYGPALQFSFLFAYILESGSITTLQIVYACIDIFLIILLLKLASPNRVLLYAWSPLVIKELIITAHPDGLAVFLLIASLLCFMQRKNTGAVVLLAFAVCAKIFALLLSPFILYYCTTQQRLLFVAVVFALYLPFTIMGGTDLLGLFTFAKEFEFNAALFSLLQYLLPETGAKLICIGIFLGFYGLYFRHYIRCVTPSAVTLPRGDLIFGVFLLCAPVLNAWYLVWLLPFAVVFRGSWVWIASISVMFSYTTGLHLNNLQMGAYELAAWVKPVEFGSIAIAIGYDILRRYRQRQGQLR